MYVQLKTGYNTDRGPAWISVVPFSKSWRTAYFHGRTLHRVTGTARATSTRTSMTSNPVKSTGYLALNATAPMADTAHSNHWWRKVREKRMRHSSTERRCPAENTDRR